MRQYRARRTRILVKSILALSGATIRGPIRPDAVGEVVHTPILLRRWRSFHERELLRASFPGELDISNQRTNACQEKGRGPGDV